jgi:hypothetical protein
MKRQFQNSKHIFRPRPMGATRLSACILSLAALLTIASPAHAAKPIGGIAVLLPPFLGQQKPQPVLPNVQPFDILGFIQSATLDTPCNQTTCDYMAGGWMELNGLKIRVPKNTIFQFPATGMSWADMFKNAPAPYLAQGQSGLAMSDTPKPLATTEVHVIGNRVVNPATGRDEYVAGLIFIAQQALNGGTGIINAIDYSKCTAGVPCMPDVWVGSTLAARTGARFRMNTPNGIYGAPDANLAAGLVDIRFTADEGNPTMVARTGYPMCLPRIDPAVGNDSLCPTWNRPVDPFTGAYSYNFTMSAAAAGAPDANGVTHQAGYPNTTVHPDPFEQAPYAVGDVVTYAGNLIQDAPCLPGAPLSSCQYISAHTVGAELGIYTAPSTWPAYVFQGSFLLGVGGVPNPLFPQEALEKIFGDFFSTDSSQLVDMYAEDVNSTTGAVTHRFFSTADPFGPPLGGLKGRARFRSVIGNYLPPPRFLAVATRALTGGQPIDTILPTARLTANGLKAGFYTAPIFDYIFAENLVLGAQQIPITFQEFPFLTNGMGPYTPWNQVDSLPVANVGQLDPWPGLSAPPQLPNSTGMSLVQAPVANAGSPQTVPQGSLVTLSGAGSSDSNLPAMQMIYTWEQMSGPPVSLQNVNNMQPLQTFFAPAMAPGAAPVTLSFQLAVCNGATCGGVSTVSITVMAAVNASSVTLSSSKTLNIVPGTDTVTLTAVTTCGGVCATPVTFAQTAGPVQTLTVLDANHRSFKAILPAGTRLPAMLTFTAKQTNAGTTSTATINVFVGADTVTVTLVVYKLSRSSLAVNVNTNALPKGAAVITVTPLVNKKVSGPGVVCTYDPAGDTYNIGFEAFTVNPVPDSVRITSNYGANIVAPVTSVR